MSLERNSMNWSRKLKMNKRLIFCYNNTEDIFHGIEYLNPKSADFFLYLGPNKKCKKELYNNAIHVSFEPKSITESRRLTNSPVYKLYHALRFYYQLPKLIKKYNVFYF